MGYFIAIIAIVVAFLGIGVTINEVDKRQDRTECEMMERTTGFDLRFVEVHWGDWGCFAPHGDDWIDIESGRVIP